MGSRISPPPTPPPPTVTVMPPTPQLRKIRALRFLEESDQMCIICDQYNENKHYNMYIFECGAIAHIECCMKNFLFRDRPHTCPTGSGCTTGLSYVMDRVVDQYIDSPSNDDENDNPPLYVVPFKKNMMLDQLGSLRCPCCREPLHNTKYGPYYILECQHIYHVSCFLNHVLHNYDNPSCLVCGTKVYIQDAYSDAFKACISQYNH